VQVFLYLGLVFAAIGAAVGVVLALVIERRR
jgi:ABC-type lipoprotein release transport system permease subunit